MLTFLSAFTLPSLYCGVISTSGCSTGFFESSTIALFTIALSTSTSSFTFTVKIMFLSFMSVIFSYFAIILPASSFNSTGAGLSPSAFRLSFTNSKPDGISSSIFTSASFPSFTVLLNEMRYSISSPSFGSFLLTFLSALILPSLYCGVILAVGSVIGWFGSST
ncbi:LSU ribosomal protein L11p (L12e) [Bacillus cereus]|uniref:LSU ribosomal protein L11p (L12e) n=1 Tax=Bacillus cereus TaxID=1396 RepID=A0A164PWL1_BACCE|nr:LSU ribosomal protein L11p (L12e) [Bacillus cereus]